ncbi:MAG: hypothetical protein ABFS86_08575 [Planctomycetota bacterium]
MRPSDGDSLARALAAGLADCLEPETVEPVVSASGGAWPDVASLLVDLTGCRLRTDRSAFGASADGATTPGPVVAELDLGGRPVTIGGTTLTLDLTAKGAGFRFSEGDDPVVMVLDGHDGGEASLFVTRDELERRVAEGLGKKLGPQGVKVLSVALDLAPAEGNRVDVDIALTLRMMFKAKLRAKARLRLDDDITLVVEDTSVTGENMGGKTFASLARPQLTELTGKEFAFGNLLPAGVRLADVRLSTDAGLGVAARIVPDSRP